VRRVLSFVCGVLTASALTVVAFAGAAEQPHTAAALRMLQESFPNLRVLPSSAVNGDLNGDGLRDVAVLAYDRAPEARSTHDPGGDLLKIVVVLGKPHHAFQHLATSADTYAHENVFQNLRVRGKTLSFTRSGSGGCCSDWSTTYHFAMRSGDLMLVGEDSTNTSKGNQPINDYGHEIDYVSGRVVYWRKTTNRSVRVRRTFRPVPLQPLRAFSYEVSSILLPEIRGKWIGENFRLRSINDAAPSS
jgi:hypothetical protein